LLTLPYLACAIFSDTAFSEPSYGSTEGPILADNAALSGCISVPPGLVSWWRAENNFADATGLNSGYAATVGYAVGEVDHAFDFNGTNSYVEISNSASLNPTGSFSIEGWIYPRADQANHIFSKWTGSGGNLCYVLRAAVNRGIHFALSDAAHQWDPTFHFFEATNVITLNAWNHVAAVYDQTQGVRRLYVNGVQVGAKTNGAITVTAGTLPVVIGANLTTSSGPIGYVFNGLVDEMSFYSKALTAGEIQSICLADTGGKCRTLPPAILTQPIPRTVYAGSTVNFSVTAGGETPLMYQWRLGSAGLSGATGSMLALSNVQPGQSGYYSVVISNFYGAVSSSSVLLNVLPIPDCAPAPDGLVSWWRSESNILDTVGLNSGYAASVGYGAGKSGQAFDFNGSSSYVGVSNSASLNPKGSFSIEGWIYPRADQANHIFSKWTGSGGNLCYLLRCAANRGIHFAISDAAHQGDSTFHAFEVSNVITLNAWNHVAAVYDQAQGVRRLYVNGVQVGAKTNGSITVSAGTLPVVIGANLTSSSGSIGYFFNGLVDEMAFYSKALTPAEIASLYLSDITGKCQTPPFIITQPASRIVPEGQDVTFAVAAGGVAQLRYQWRWEGHDVAGATGSSLALTNVQVPAAGNYSVFITNAFGWVVSSNALLTVNRSPVAQCTNVILPAGTNCMADASVDNGSFDPDGDLIALLQSPPGPYPLGTNAVTLTVTDPYGASNICNALVIVQDRTPPGLASAPDKRVECGALWSFDPPLATDNCSPATVSVLNTVTNTLCGGAFAATRTWLAMDASGNHATCSQTVVVVDTTPPTVTCPSPQTLEFQDESGAVASYVVTASDTCSAVSLAVTPASGSRFGIGTTEVLAQATDSCSNRAQCSFTVTVLGAQGVKSNVLAELTALRSSVAPKQTFAQMFDEAIQHLAASLTPSYWVDQTHLIAKSGNTAINEEKLAAKTLADFRDAKGCPVQPALLQGFIERIVKCDRLLAVISVQEAAQAGLNAKKVAEDFSLVAKGDDEASKGHCANAIEHYRDAWRHALQLRLQLAANADGSTRLHFVGNNRQSYRIEVSADLVRWTVLGLCAGDSDGNVEFTDPTAAGEAVRFYRVVEQ
jgi:hypothetical protein